MRFSSLTLGSLGCVFVLFTAACPADHTTPCGDQVCRQGFSCDSIHDECVVPAQLEVCVGEPDGAECLINGANGFVCDQEVCLQSVCGDGILDVHTGELCDDGNTVDDDGCPNNCTPSACGDAILDPGEECDGSDLNSQDCNSRGYDGGQLTCGNDCLFDESLCAIQCGNGLIHSTETCDDSNNAAGDGCSDLCTVEDGWECTGTPSICTPGFTTVTAGGAHTCALRADDTVWCWGLNENGQLGDGNTDNSSIPVQISSLSEVVDISSGGWHTCALLSDSSVWCWGLNNVGQLGNGSTTLQTTPNPVPGQVINFTGAVAIFAGGAHTCALKADDTTWCWGLNINGQLGDGSAIDSSIPVHVSGLSGVASIAGGGAFTCAVKTDGTVWCWGINEHGQLGDGNTTDVNTANPNPVQVVGLAGADFIDAGGWHTCAVKNDGTAWCWGFANKGQLGNDSMTDSPLPVQVIGLTDAVSIATGVGHSCASKSDGTAWCWGWNEKGQVGDNTMTDRTLAVQVDGLTGAEAVFSMGEYTCASTTDGTVWCWGWNFFGQLGDGTMVDRPAPVEVSTP